MSATVHLKDDFKNPWFLGILGLVGMALAATVWMAVIAGSTSTGLVNEDYYQKGKDYFHQSPTELQGPQWRLNLMAPASTKAGQSQLYRLYVIAEDGKPVNEGSVTLFAYRPSDAKADFEIAMLHQDTGTYSAEINFPLPGTWDLIAQIEADGKRHDVAQRLFVGD